MKQLLLLLLCAALHFTANAQSVINSNAYLEHIEKNGQEPMQYLADKICKYSVVAIGEDHWVKDHPMFFCEVIGTMAADTTANIDVLALEFGNSIDQKLVNELLNSSEYREDLVFKILQHAPDDYGNPYKEYADVFRKVWETNQVKPKEYRTQIVLLDPAYIQQVFDKEEVQYTCSRDDNMVNLIRWYIIQRKHVVFYAGGAHTTAQIRGIRNGDYYYNYPSAGYLLKKCYPNDVFIITLWGAYMGANGYIPDEKTRWVQLAGGVIDEAFRMNGNKPVAFNLGGAFASLTVADYFGNPDGKLIWVDNPTNGSPYVKTNLLADGCDGIIFIKPTEEFSGIHLIDIYDEEFLKCIEKRSEGKCKTSEQTLKEIKGWHSILEY